MKAESAKLVGLQEDYNRKIKTRETAAFQYLSSTSHGIDKLLLGDTKGLEEIRRSHMEALRGVAIFAVSSEITVRSWSVQKWILLLSW